MKQALAGLLLLGLVIPSLCLDHVILVPGASTTRAAESSAGNPDRSPVDLVLTTDEQYLLTANQTSGTVSLVHAATGKLLHEVGCGNRPSALALTPDENHVLVSGTWSGDVTIFERKPDRLVEVGRIATGFEPRGIAVSPDGKLAYVALTTAHEVVVIDLSAKNIAGRITVGRWPRYLALTPDGKRLAVGACGDGGVSVVDTSKRERLYQEEFSGLNLGQMQVSKDGRYVYFPWMVYRHNPITSGNIRLGWVLASRIARVRLDGLARREAISLDPQGMAVSDPHGLALSPDEQWLVCSASGTHELLVYRASDLPYKDYGGPGDHIDAALLKDRERFARIPLGGRPMAVRYSRDGKHLFVANYLHNTVQVVDVPARTIVRTIRLGGPEESTLARRGEAIFYDGQRSFEQWYSCHSCHQEGHTNAVAMDTRNDGRFGNFKTVLSLRNVKDTGPWFWHGWQKDLATAVRKSMTDTMLGKEPAEEDVQALLAFLETLEPPPNPNRTSDGEKAEAAKRGERVFRSEKAGCQRCHSGPHHSDGKIHIAGLEARNDVYRGYNPPSLTSVYDRVLFLHDGRAKSLEEALRGPHNPAKVTNRGELTEQELQDLLAFLRTL